MSSERRQILEMLAQDKISTEDAERLLDKLATSGSDGVSVEGTAPRYLRVVVEGGEGDRVNVRVPMALIRTGLKLTTMLPPQASERLAEKGIDLSGLGDMGSEELIEALQELTVNVDAADGEKVRVYCE